MYTVNYNVLHIFHVLITYNTWVLKTRDSKLLIIYIYFEILAECVA